MAELSLQSGGYAQLDEDGMRRSHSTSGSRRKVAILVLGVVIAAIMIVVVIIAGGGRSPSDDEPNESPTQTPFEFAIGISFFPRALEAEQEEEIALDLCKAVHIVMKLELENLSCVTTRVGHDVPALYSILVSDITGDVPANLESVSWPTVVDDFKQLAVDLGPYEVSVNPVDVPVRSPTSSNLPPSANTQPTAPSVTPRPTPGNSPTTSPPTNTQPTAGHDVAVCTACRSDMSKAPWAIGCSRPCPQQAASYTYCTACARENWDPRTGGECVSQLQQWLQGCPAEPTPEPTKSGLPIPPQDAVYTMNFVAVGDWGVTADGDHISTTGKTEKNSELWWRHFNAQSNIAKHMVDFAKLHPPQFVLAHGDSFYWTGVSSKHDDRFRTVFEEVYADASLMVPWYNVLGNHDLGGGSGFCGPSCWSCGVQCDTTAEMETALLKKVESQVNYASPNGDRWVMEHPYYSRKHLYPPEATEATAEYSVEIFNIDTNAAGDRLPNTCCQCFGSAANQGLCNNPNINGNECVMGRFEQYQRCAEIIEGWWAASMVALRRDLLASTATWKIVHNHYLMVHFTPAQQAEVRGILEEGGAHIFIGGHRHAEGHELQNGIHYIENGGGGGKNKNGGCPSGQGNCVWGSNTYGFMGASLSRYYMKLEFIDDMGATLHCYHVPVDRSDKLGDGSKWTFC